MARFFVESAGAVLAVRQSRDDGEPLLLLHGGPGVPDYMQAAMAPMLPNFDRPSVQIAPVMRAAVVARRIAVSVLNGGDARAAIQPSGYPL
jgi:hypothetical protein